MSVSETGAREQPLDGIRVIELGQYIAAPYCAMLLADQGAEVIKVERPGVGDPRRSYDPLVRRDGRSMSGGFMSYNRNKKSITLNLREPAGRDLFARLARSVDVIVENLRPGSMERLGLGYETLRRDNPRLVYCAISGFGRDGVAKAPYSHRPAFDTPIQAMSGMMSLIGETGGEPLPAPAGFSDIYTGVLGSLAVTSALYARERTGVGAFVDQAMYDSLVSLMERPLMLHAFTGEVPTRGVDHFAPVGALRAADGYVALIIPTDEMWRRFCVAIERPDLREHPKLASVLTRSKNWHAVLKPEAERWTGVRPRREVTERLIAEGVPVGEVQTIDEVYACPHLEGRGMFIEIDDPATGTIRLPRTPLKFDCFAQAPATRPPQLGEHTEAVLAELAGVARERCGELREAGVL